VIHGYARVSTDGQSIDAQVKPLRTGKAKRIFKETASGARSDRAELARLRREGSQAGACHREARSGRRRGPTVYRGNRRIA
jgi:DNA invertase Pin-like site-specific DNA recombinase